MGALLGLIGVVGSLVKSPLKPILPFLGGVAKGKLTGLGAVGAAVGGVVAATTGADSHIVTNSNVVALVHEIGIVAVALFSCIGSFGVAREARDAHHVATGSKDIAV